MPLVLNAPVDANNLTLLFPVLVEHTLDKRALVKKS